MSWRIRLQDVKPEPCASSRQGLQWMNEVGHSTAAEQGSMLTVLAMQQGGGALQPGGLDLVGLGVAGTRGSVTSSHSLTAGQQTFTTVGIYKVQHEWKAAN
jgi:hypothetical protein